MQLDPSALFKAILFSPATLPSPAAWMARLTVAVSIFAIAQASGQFGVDAPADVRHDAPHGRPVTPSFHWPVAWAAELGSPGPRSAIKEAHIITPFDPEIASPFHFHGSATDRSRAADCLATAAWYEAGDDPAGQQSVIQVVLNRVRHPAFPKSICAVVFEGSQRPTGCQFTFTCDGSLTRRTPSLAALMRARALANRALDGSIDRSVMQATHYHADYVAPVWSGQLERLSKVGLHVFYRWPGRRGALSDKVQYGTEISVTALGNRGGAPGALSAPSSTSAGGQSANLMGAVDAPKQARGITTSAVFLAVDRSAPSGRWAVEALGKCTGRQACQVLGYENDQQIGRNRGLAAGARDRPIFLFVRDAASGMDVALWDCKKVDRPNRAQCLPTAGPTLDDLMRERAG